jgi:ubiquinone/menaquinone biosynthesis C-methylase UbiE
LSNRGYSLVVLSRVLEPEVMDTADDAEEYDAMDHVQVNAAFVADLLARLGAPHLVLDVGTGTALIPLELGRRTDATRVVGVDMAREMLRLGRRNIARTSPRQRIVLLLADAKHLPFGDRSVPAVASNSLVHHIPDPRAVLAELVRVAARPVRLFVRDLLRPSDEHALQALVDKHAADGTPKQRAMLADSLRASLTLEELRGMVSGLGFSPESVQQTSDRHWTWCVGP